jgi:hypothetical protein
MPVSSSWAAPICAGTFNRQNSDVELPNKRHDGRRAAQHLGQLLALAVLSSASRNPLASLSASSLAQKCMKNQARLLAEHMAVDRRRFSNLVRGSENS